MSLLALVSVTLVLCGAVVVSLRRPAPRRHATLDIDPALRRARRRR